MSILVTGGAGFIGSHLCEKLLQTGENVICVDNLFTGSKTNIEHLLSQKNFKFILADIVAPLFLEDRITQVYNLACPASPVHYQYNAVHTIKANTLGMINMLGLAKRHKARILQASTSEVYGDPLVHPQREDYRGNVNTIGPRACYDEGKRCAETLMFDYHRMHSLEIKVARIFNTYGPRMSFADGRVISNFIVQALRGEDITVYGTGSQTRSFCYVSDLVDGLVLLMNSGKEITGPINLGNPGEKSMKEIAELVVGMTGSASKLVYQDLPIDDPRRRCPDISRAKSMLGWQPEVSLEDGLRRTIADFESRLQAIKQVQS
jgi:UDP-glucuronate decarboxylase